MPTRKQRRKAQKERRHEYETVWVDEEGNELEEPPDEALVSAPSKKADTKARSSAKGQSRGGRTARVPLPPSWPRAAKRSALLGVVVFFLFLVLNSKSSGNSRIESALIISVIYTAIFIPFTFAIDRFSYRRYEKQQTGAKRR